MYPYRSNENAIDTRFTEKLDTRCDEVTIISAQEPVLAGQM